jgi:hypothetical protein
MLNYSSNKQSDFSMRYAVRVINPALFRIRVTLMPVAS